MSEPKTIFVSAALLCNVLAFSQQVDVTVHFPKGSAEIESASRDQLILWVQSNLHHRHDPIHLRGHTDSDADNSFNMDLSRKRNDAVLALLSAKGFDHIESLSFGESWPLCNDENEACMESNRRVELILFNEPSETFLLEQNLAAPQVNFIANETGGVVKGKEGTMVYIPKASFVRPDGSPATGVRIELREFYNIKECMKAKLTTTSDGKILESGGMILLEAFSENEKLEVAGDSKLDIVFTSQVKGLENGMQVFYGDASTGKMNWTTTPMRQPLVPEPLSVKVAVSWNCPQWKVIQGSWDEWNAVDSTWNAYYASTTPEERKKRSEEIEKKRLASLTPEQRKMEQQKKIEYAERTRQWQLQNTVINSITAKGVGWINCDRFYTSPNGYITQKVNIDIEYPAQAYMYFEDINSIIGGYRNPEGIYEFQRVPKGSKVKIVVFRYGDDKNMFAIKNTVTSITTLYIQPEERALPDIEAELNVFNKFI